jgi:hypothetical protein
LVLLDLWPPIMAIVKKYDNNSQALHFLKIAYKKHGVSSLCEKLRGASLWDWFTPQCDLDSHRATWDCQIKEE